MPKPRRPHTVILKPITDETAERVAAIIGGSSAMSLALAEARRRRNAGEPDVRLWKSGHSILVGPPPEPAA